MKIVYCTIWLLCFAITTGQAQKRLSWRKRAKLALAQEADGQLKQAANNYWTVFKEKPDKLIYSYKAGCCFLELRDYNNAIKALEVVKSEPNHPEYGKAGFKYALALKQTGQAQAAKDAFNTFLIAYQQEDKELYQELVETEIKGCNYALKAKNYTNPRIQIEHLERPINQSKTEFAPIPFANDVLYFSSTKDGAAKIYRTVKKNGRWSNPLVPSIFKGKMERDHFGNGTFTEDGQRFYFTQCDIEGGKPQCAIYLMENLGGGEWSDPLLLPDYINTTDINTTHPLVISTEDQEILYFASNRPGGRGGLDLWYTVRALGSPTMNFSLPKNLGRNINSAGDEISPFYHKPTNTLYFSSNGRVSAGGLDIFKSKGSKLQWEVAQNMGFPINSAADDLYYTISEAHKGGYLVSNRPSAPKRTQTIDDDIFYVGIEQITLSISGTIVDAADTEELLLAANVKLFKKTESGEELIGEQISTDGSYTFTDLEPTISYFLEAEALDYERVYQSFETGENSAKLEQQLALAKIQRNGTPDKVDPQLIRYYIMAAKYNSNSNAYQLPEDPTDPNTGLPYTGDTLKIFYELDAIAGLGDDRKLFYDKNGQAQPYHQPLLGVTKNTPTPIDGPYQPSDLAPPEVVYKIQVSAVRKFRSKKYEALKEVGRLTMEDIGGLRRILVVHKEENKDFFEEGYKRKSDALNALSYILNNTRFEYAFVIKYVDGERVGEGFRGWNEEEGLQTDSRPDGYVPEDAYEGF